MTRPPEITPRGLSWLTEHADGDWGGVLPDHQIRKLVRITPFVDHGECPPGVVSYGLGHYGYDMRVDRKFKIFTNALCGVVDPKAFDERSFVDWEGDHCLIPPNSFALGSSVEHFEIPRDTLGIVLGKCLAAETRVVNADTGDWLPIGHPDVKKLSNTPSLRTDGAMIVSPVECVTDQLEQPVLRLTTMGGRSVRATANHPFYRASGWTDLGRLKPGDFIAAPAVVPVFGHEDMPTWECALLGLMISEGQCHTPGHSPTFTSTDPVLVDVVTRAVRDGFQSVSTYKGRYGWRLVNRAGRGGKMTRNRVSDWLRGYQLDVGALGKFIPPEVFRLSRDPLRWFLRALFSGDGSAYKRNDVVNVEYATSSGELAEGVRHLLSRFGVIAGVQYRQSTDSWTVNVLSKVQVSRFNEQIGFWPGSVKQSTLEAGLADYREGSWRNKQSLKCLGLPPDGRVILDEALRLCGVPYRQLQMKPSSKTVSHRQLSLAAALTSCPRLTALARGDVYWDRVVSVEQAGTARTYDLTVPGTENFVAGDLISHNSTYARCGVICNVTPLEPMWRGKVTIEVSNTTPLPAKIYAGEGIAQVIFLKCPSPIACLVSYEDKKGRYQDQKGLTLPFVRKE